MTRKKLLMLIGSVVLALMLVVPLVVACAGPAPTSTPTPTTPTPTPSPSPTPTPAPPATPQVFKWRCQASCPPVEEMYIRLLDFWAEVKEETNGQIDVTMYGEGAIIPVMEILPSVVSGTIEMGFTVPGYFRSWAPSFAYAWGYPSFALSYFDTYGLYMSYGLMDLLQEDALDKSGGKLMLLPACGEDAGLIAKEPIRGIADFKGLKMRSSGLLSEWFSVMGASTTYIAGSELYTALATGVVDAAHFGTFLTEEEMKLYEVVDYYMTPSPGYGMVFCWLFNTDVWDTLPQELQYYLELKLLKYFAPYGKAYHDDIQHTIPDVWSKKCTEVRIPLEELEKMNEMGLEIGAQFATDDAAARAFEIVKQYLKDRKAETGI